MSQNKHYQSLRHKRPVRCEKYAGGVSTQKVSLRREKYASHLGRGIQACKHLYWIDPRALIPAGLLLFKNIVGTANVNIEEIEDLGEKQAPIF